MWSKARGDRLSPTIFGIFINDIVNDVKSVNIVININGINVCILLLYADDIVLLSETDERLQKLLDKVYGKSSLMPRNLTFYTYDNLMYLEQITVLN